MKSEEFAAAMFLRKLFNAFRSGSKFFILHSSFLIFSILRVS